MAKAKVKTKKQTEKKPLTQNEILTNTLVPEDEQPYKIPDNWVWVRLTSCFANVTSSEKKIQQKDYFNEGLYAIIDQGKELIGGYTNNKNILYEGNLPVIVFGDHTRIIKYIDFPFAQGADGVKLLYPNKFINSKYFYYYLQNINIPNLGYRRHFPLFPQFCIAMPPFHEQQLIVERIENLFKKLDRAKELAQNAIDSFGTSKAAILHKAFSGELTAKWRKENKITLDSWRIKKLEEIGNIITGSTPNKKNKEYFNGEILFIKPTELNQERNVFFSDETLSELGKSVSRPIRAGSTCVCCIGATISKCGFLTVDAVTNQQINSIVPFKNMDDLYVYYYCCSSYFKQTLIENSSSTTLPIINKSRMSVLEIPVPSIPEQKEIVRILDCLFEKEKRARELCGAIGKIDLMKKAILARAFRGELGTGEKGERDE